MCEVFEGDERSYCEIYERIEKGVAKTADYAFPYETTADTYVEPQPTHTNLGPLLFDLPGSGQIVQRFRDFSRFSNAHFHKFRVNQL